MKLEISLFKDSATNDAPKVLTVDLCESFEVAGEKWALYPVEFDGTSYLVSLDDLCILGHAAQVRNEARNSK